MWGGERGAVVLLGGQGVAVQPRPVHCCFGRLCSHSAVALDGMCAFQSDATQSRPLSLTQAVALVWQTCCYSGGRNPSRHVCLVSQDVLRCVLGHPQPFCQPQASCVGFQVSKTHIGFAGAVPLVQPATPLSRPVPGEWLLGTPMGSPHTKVRYLDTLPQVSEKQVRRGG